MERFENILAIINGKDNRNHTLSKAMYLSNRSNANITIFNISKEQEITAKDFSYLPFVRSEGDTSNMSSGTKTPRITLKNKSGFSAHSVILDEIENVSYDLIVKDKTAEHFNYLGLAMSTDKHLLRESNIPILLVTERPWHSKGSILTAVETEEDTKAHQHCNNQILEHSERFAELLHSNIHLLNCYLGESVSMSIDSQTHISEKRHHWQDLVKASRKLNGKGDDTKLYLEIGLPDEVIPSVADKNKVNLVVMGTSEHGGVFNRMFGHTSEYIIDNLNRDVLAVKPAFEILH